MQWINGLAKKLIPCILAIISYSFVFAHSPSNSSSLLIEGENGMWMLQIRSALTALEQEVHTRFSADSYKTPEEFKNLVAEILQKDLSLSFENSPHIALKKPQIKLGHETLVVYQFKGPEQLDSFIFRNESFRNIANSKNVLFVVKKGIDKNQFTLNRHNNFEIRLVADGNNYRIFGPTQESKIKYAWFVAGLTVILLIIVVLGYKKKLKPTNYTTNGS
ncbi:hypothetical protein EHW67_11445 [Arenibacter aquaticus]|uniref:Uncharacterized protein n=1 Tax=Arenibacter aquaticus TaxID=2489054 RepID=A0A3S0CKT5_9FLAO|nr:hypothetical protein [Arenibacter aquaticus]RTE53607.1 hypothetical protein EHW67_11445 [Arenibacter aquaticus]